MKSYYFNSILYNKRIYILISVICTVAFSLSYILIQILINMAIEQKSAQFEDMFTMLIAFCVVILATVISMLSMLYKILYLGRRKEIENLRYIGCSIPRIKRLFNVESFILGAGVSGISFVIGTVITFLFNIYYNDPIKPSVFSIILYFIILNLIFCLVAKSQLKKSIETILFKKKTKEKDRYLLKSVIAVICSAGCLCVYFIIEPIFNLTKILGIERSLLEEIIITIIVLVQIKPVVVIILSLLSMIIERIVLPNLFLTIKKIIYDLNVFIKVINNAIFSVAVLIFFLVMFNSIPKSTVDFIDNSTSYNYKYNFNEAIDKKEITPDSVISSTLEVIGYTSNNKQILLKGIDETYNKVEKIMLVESDSIIGENEKQSNIPIIVSGIDAKSNNWGIGETVEIEICSTTCSFNIVGIASTFIYGEAYVEKEKLSNAIFDTGEMVNTLYTSDKLRSEEMSVGNFEYQSREAIIDGAKESVLGGTEFIEMIIYIYAISSLCMLLNVFIIINENNTFNNIALKKIGFTKKRISKIQIMENTIAVTISLVGGIGIGFWAIQGLPDIIYTLYQFSIKIYYPNSLYIIFASSILAYIVFARVMKNYIENNLERS